MELGAKILGANGWPALNADATKKAAMAALLAGPLALEAPLPDVAIGMVAREKGSASAFRVGATSAAELRYGYSSYLERLRLELLNLSLQLCDEPIHVRW